MTERSINFLWCLGSMTLLAMMFMVTQCAQNEAALATSAEVVCVSAGGEWVPSVTPTGAGNCFHRRP